MVGVERRVGVTEKSVYLLSLRRELRLRLKGGSRVGKERTKTLSKRAEGYTPRPLQHLPRRRPAQYLRKRTQTE